MLRKSFPDLVQKITKICFSQLLGRHPLLILQMGKVGSSTLYRTLIQSGLKNPIYHVHFISKTGIEKAVKEHFRCKQLPYHLIESKNLEKIFTWRPHIQLKIISLVRDPIERAVSDIFQNASWKNPSLISDEGKFLIKDVIAYLEKSLADFDEKKDYCCNWFQNEICEPFQINIFDTPFNYAQGIQVVETNRVKLLIIDLDRLNKCFTRIIPDFLDFKGQFFVAHANIRKKTSAAEQYLKVHHELRIPKDVCERIYASKFSQHFFSGTKREQLKKKWARN